MMTGVFRPTALLTCSLSGRNYTDSSEDSDSSDEEEIEEEAPALHGLAVHAIIRYAMKQAKKRSWPRMSVAQIESGLRRKIYQVREEYRRAQIQNRRYVYE
ncbi:hypothetical protein QAD02_000752 [Eretmocerus hayati]|uniref:Uncharacterized protein n=1 Tax=Eretmocerus hayati TaxID=131215 RepID=A0ACC2NEX3_9HYME|nr:hypothetical protein QAD02_000752 [Eretmocerus hayati]